MTPNQNVTSSTSAFFVIFAKKKWWVPNLTYKGNNKITELRAILQRESQNS